jgi:hypothetical protein
LNHEIEQALDELLDAITSSLYTDNGRSLRPALSERSNHNRNERLVSYPPLLRFWMDLIVYVDPDRYILPRFERLEQGARSLETLGHIFSQISNRSWFKLPVIWQKLFDALFVRSGGRSRGAFVMGNLKLSTDGAVGGHCNLLSFLGHNICEEHISMITGVFLAFVHASWQDPENWHDQWRDCTKQLFKLGEAWDIYHCFAKACETGVLSPLQIQVPYAHVNSNLSALAGLQGLQLPRRTLRLLCLNPKELATGPIVKAMPFVVVACFDISEQCSKAMGDPVIDYLSYFGDLAEPTGQERCLQLILNDIWEDSDAQLDAWQRLYVRAYVRKWFKYLWVRRADE